MFPGREFLVAMPGICLLGMHSVMKNTAIPLENGGVCDFSL